jgi:glucose/arabinose dehydrogenase
MRNIGIASLLLLLFAACNSVNLPTAGKQDPRLDQIKLPEGFQIEIFAEGVDNARSITRGDKGTIFVGTRGNGSVYAVVDKDNDYKADTIYTLATGLFMPNGVTFKDGSLYVAEVNKIWRYDNIEDHLTDVPKPVLVTDKLPSERHHGWKYIDFGPDGKLYAPVGAPCNICEKDEEIYASIMRMDADGSNLEVYASGVRNSVGFTWHPVTKELWFTENGRDMMGDDMPADELNHAPKKGMHFGYPYCHQGDTPDPKYGEGKSCDDYIAPAMKLNAHVAALGVHFYDGAMFPEKYKHQALICEHGSWNRSKPIGYRIMMVEMKDGKAVSYKPFAEGWLKGDAAWGRPVDLLQLPDGSLLVSDDDADMIYRISYKK